MRNTCRLDDEPISPETFTELLLEIERANPGKWRRMVAVCPVAVEHVIDNEADARETIRRIRKRLAEPAPKKGEGGERR